MRILATFSVSILLAGIALAWTWFSATQTRVTDVKGVYVELLHWSRDAKPEAIDVQDLKNSYMFYAGRIVTVRGKVNFAGHNPNIGIEVWTLDDGSGLVDVASHSKLEWFADEEVTVVGILHVVRK